MLKHQLRRFSAKKLESVLPYTSYPIDDREFLGTFNGSLKEAIAYLKENGYSYQLFAAIKSVGGIEDFGSYARISDGHPDSIQGSKVGDLDKREAQYHIHPFKNGNKVDFYGHYEIHPNPFVPTFDLTRPWPRHYRPKKYPKYNWEEVTYVRGVKDERLTEIK